LQYLARGAAAAAALVLLAWLGARTWPKVKSWLEGRRIERERSEAAHFQRFEAACRTGDRLAAYAALDSWSRRASVSPVSAWLSRFGGPEACEEFERFERSTFGRTQDSESWDSRGLSGALSQTRRAWLNRDRTVKPAPALPELNP
jgi:hypothetical protein